MKAGDNGPSAGLAALGAGAMVFCCLLPLLLLGVGTTGLVALVTANAWWLGLGGVALIIGAVAAQMSRMRRSRPGPERAASGPVQHREERNRT